MLKNKTKLIALLLAFFLLVATLLLTLITKQVQTKVIQCLFRRYGKRATK